MSHLVQRDLVVSAVVELRGARRLVSAVRLGVPDGPAVFKLRRDVSGAEGRETALGQRACCVVYRNPKAVEKALINKS